MWFLHGMLLVRDWLGKWVAGMFFVVVVVVIFTHQNTLAVFWRFARTSPRWFLRKSHSGTLERLIQSDAVKSLL